MLTVIWEIVGFCVVDLMIEQHRYNTQHFLSRILEPVLLAVFPDGRELISRRLSLHLDECCVHRSTDPENFAENSIIKISHLPYSPDLATSDF
jgi:hypothetical protein